MLYDDFQTDVEERARAAGVRVRLAKQLTELEKQFYGSSMSYDRAMAGEEALDRALHRNVYLLQPGYEPSAQLLARYVRRCVRGNTGLHVSLGAVLCGRSAAHVRAASFGQLHCAELTSGSPDPPQGARVPDDDPQRGCDGGQHQVHVRWVGRCCDQRQRR